MELKEQLKQMRLGMRRTQAQFGELLGVSGNTIARWERGEMVPDSPRLLELALVGLQLEYGVIAMPAETRQRIRRGQAMLKESRRELDKLLKENGLVVGK